MYSIIGSRGKPIAEGVLVVDLGLQMREEIFRDRVVPAHPDGSHGLRDTVPGAPFLEFVRSVLGAPTRMNHRCFPFEVPVVTGHPSVRR